MSSFLDLSGQLQGQGHLLLFLGLGLLTLLAVAPVSEADDDWTASYPKFDASRSEEGTLEVARDRRIPSIANLMAIPPRKAE